MAPHHQVIERPSAAMRDVMGGGWVWEYGMYGMQLWHAIVAGSGNSCGLVLHAARPVVP